MTSDSDAHNDKEAPAVPIHEDGQQNDRFNYLTGWRLHGITLGMCLGLFLINVEITIVSTAQVSITDDLDSFSKSSWIITAYLITYITGIAVWAQLSDLLGRKPTFIASLLIFTAFSAGCGAARTMVQLIVCRAFQGIGGSGTYSLSILMVYELVPPPKYPTYTAMSTLVIALAAMLGPVFGGLITARSTWRWVFLLNVPAGLLAAAILFLTIPRDFPHQGRPSKPPRRGLRAVDGLGSFLMLAALALVIIGLSQAASELSWKSATVLAPLCVSPLVWMMFLASQWHASRPRNQTVPIFPWYFCQDRVILGLIMTSFMTGAVSVTCIFELPIRYQTAAGLSPLEAGVRLIPMSACGPLGAVIGAMLTKNKRVPPLFLALGGALMQIIGLVFLSQASPNDPDWHGLYGLEVLIGLGFGLGIAAGTLLAPFVVKKGDLAAGNAAAVQFRFLGSATVISLTTAVGNSSVKHKLSGLLTSSQIESIFRKSAAINTLPMSLQPTVRSYFVESFNVQMRIVLGFAVATILCALMMWKRNQIRVP